MQEFVNRFAAGQRSSQVQSRRKEMARLAPTEMKKSNIARPYIRFEQRKPSGREVVTVAGLSKSFDGQPVLKDINFEVSRGEKVAIIGPNGVGKTTLVRCLVGDLTPDAGTVKWGTGMTWGYYPQDYRSGIPAGLPALDWAMSFDEENQGQQFVRGLLGQMLFKGDESLKPTEALSGGEAARLLMAKLMLEKSPGPDLRRADQPPGPGSGLGPGRRAVAVRRHGLRRLARPGPDLGNGDAHPVLHAGRVCWTSGGPTTSTWKRTRCRSAPRRAAGSTQRGRKGTRWWERNPALKGRATQSENRYAVEETGPRMTHPQCAEATSTLAVARPFKAGFPPPMTSRLYHVTPLHYLPHVLQSGALYAQSVLAGRGIASRAHGGAA